MTRYVKIVLISFLLCIAILSLSSCVDYKAQVAQRDTVIQSQSSEIGFLKVEVSRVRVDLQFTKEQLEKQKLQCPTTRDFNGLAEFKSFIAEDKTNEKLYITGTYECMDFTFEVIRNAAVKGLKVYPAFDTVKRHMVCYILLTSSSGETWVFTFEPQSDQIIESFKYK